MDPSKYPFLKTIQEILKSTPYLSLATCDKDCGCWCNALNFAYDNSLNLFFLSKVSSKHCVNIDKNNNVSGTIFSSAQHPHKHVRGLQFIGKANLVDDDYLDQVTGIYYGRNNIFYDPNIINDKYIKNAAWKFYIITLSELYVYDSEYFGDARALVPDRFMDLSGGVY